jgi:mercuric ion binding protein
MSGLRLLCLLTALVVTPGVWAQASLYAVGVDGMACPFCVYGLEKQIKKLDGVTEVETDLEQGEIIVSVQGDGILEKAEVDEAVRDAGFTLRSFEPLK